MAIDRAVIGEAEFGKQGLGLNPAVGLLLDLTRQLEQGRRELAQALALQDLAEVRHADLTLDDLAFLDHLLEVFATLDELECSLLLDGLRSVTCVIALAADGLHEPRALDATAELTNDGESVFAPAFLNFGVDCHSGHYFSTGLLMRQETEYPGAGGYPMTCSMREIRRKISS